MADTSGWTESQWEQWFETAVMPTLRRQWSDLDDSYSIRHVDEFGDPAIEAGFRAINAGYNEFGFIFSGHHAPQAFARLGSSTRQEFYDAWMIRMEPASQDSEPEQPEPGGWAPSDGSILITLPSGEQVRQYPDGSVTERYGAPLLEGDRYVEPRPKAGLGTKAMVIVGSLALVLSILIGLVVLSGGDDTPSAASNSTVADSVGPVTIPPDTVLSTNPTAPPNTAESEPPSPLTTIPQTIPAASVKSADYSHASHHFTVVVDGDGEDLATSGAAKWYIAEFTTTSPDGVFVVEAKWSLSEWRGRVFGASGAPIDGAVIEGEWTDPSTLVVTVEADSLPSAATSFELALLVRMLNPDGSNGEDYESSYSWSG